jgi:hypothetical protein
MTLALLALLAALPTPNEALNSFVRIRSLDASGAIVWRSGFVVATGGPSAIYPRGWTKILTAKHELGRQWWVENDDDPRRNWFRDGRVVKVVYAPDEEVASINVDKGPYPSVTRVAPLGHQIVGPVLTVGCDNGGLPSVWRANVINVGKFRAQDGSAVHNFELDRPGPHGRSGGPAYDSTGMVVGLTWGSDQRTYTECTNLCATGWVRPEHRVQVSAQGPPAASRSVTLIAPPKPEVLFFYRADDPIDVIIAGLGRRSVTYVHAETDAGKRISAIWDVQVYPSAIVVMPDPKTPGSYLEIGRLQGSKISVETLKKLSLDAL